MRWKRGNIAGGWRGTACRAPTLVEGGSSLRPLESGGKRPLSKAPSRSHCTNWMRWATPWRTALRRATANAADDMSVATTTASGSSCASATARQPEPVPTSAMRSPAPCIAASNAARVPVREPSARSSVMPAPVQLLSWPCPSRASATSMTCSVSGRGISTSGVTSNSSPQNSCRPVRYCVGTPAMRRATRCR